MLERQRICATCGHTREWHDRESARTRLGAEPTIERPCYREVGGASCRCGGFRDSGEIASPAAAVTRSASQADGRVFMRGLLALLLVVLGLALLYAYRSQAPAVPEVSATQAVQNVRSGNVRSIRVSGNVATLTFANGAQERCRLASPDEALAPAVAEYNATHPTLQVALAYVDEAPPLASWLASVLALLIVGALVFWFMRRARRAS